MVPSGEEEAKGDLTTVIHHLRGVGEQVDPVSSWRHIARGNRRKLQRGKFWLEGKKNVHGGDGEALGGGGISALGSAHSSAGPALGNLPQLCRSAQLCAGAGQETLDQVPSAQSCFVSL